ncbi:protein kinase domain-containing protein [Botrimarina hoheduenensis]|uniref:Serine/threonine-protein kinase PknL n=1 Tax=Botrimarina hoheduenensis TaxID=2528000 RepID=A0A5C5WE26_9BACT|nr:protein kinase [Botrimarina hoheduenensis]TWT48974.1 Serine/threonine-protein kinase PknL [Botrimarina hoheduenensis]
MICASCQQEHSGGDCPRCGPDSLVGDAETAVGESLVPSEPAGVPYDRSLGDKATETRGDDSSLSDSEAGPVDREWLAGLPRIDTPARYEVLEELGRGGMGVVYKARDRSTGRLVALKRVQRESRRALARFESEAKALAKLGGHQHILTMYEYGRDAQGPLLALEYVEGGSLADAGPFEEREALTLIEKLCLAAQHAHDNGVIHRDIKPANVLLTAGGEPKLADFGLVRIEGSEVAHTREGIGLGTPDYVAPEQRRDASKADARSDVYSIAATAYFLLTGKTPRTINLKRVARLYREALERALEDDPEQRTGSARELADALQSGTPIASGRLDAGTCRSCGHVNPTERRHCSSCGVHLVERCLSCMQDNCCWEKYCGWCGADLLTLVEERAGFLDGLRTEAESLRGTHHYVEAIQLLEPQTEPDHPRLRSRRQRCEELRRELEQELATLRTHHDSICDEADAAVAKHHFAKAVKLLEAIPLPLRTDRAATLLSDAGDKLTRRDALGEEIKVKLKDGIEAVPLATVDEYLKLNPNDGSVARLKLRVELQSDIAAAESGDTLAMTRVANRLLRGDGTKVDPSGAIEWLRLAVARGDSAAEQMLGTLYEEGRGVERDLTRALVLYTRAAKQEDGWGVASLLQLLAKMPTAGVDSDAIVHWICLADQLGCYYAFPESREAAMTCLARLPIGSISLDTVTAQIASLHSAVESYLDARPEAHEALLARRVVQSLTEAAARLPLLRARSALKAGSYETARSALARVTDLGQLYPPIAEMRVLIEEAFERDRICRDLLAFLANEHALFAKCTAYTDSSQHVRGDFTKYLRGRFPLGHTQHGWNKWAMLLIGFAECYRRSDLYKRYYDGDAPSPTRCPFRPRTKAEYDACKARLGAAIVSRYRIMDGQGWVGLGLGLPDGQGFDFPDYAEWRDLRHDPTDSLYMRELGTPCGADGPPQ